MKNIKDTYQIMTLGGIEKQLMTIGIIIFFLPAIATQKSKSKLLRISCITSLIVWIFISAPISLPLILAGIFQDIYQFN